MTGRELIVKICATTFNLDKDVFIVEILHRGEDNAVDKAQRVPVARVDGHKIYVEASEIYDRGY